MENAKINSMDYTEKELLDKVQSEAEELFRSGTFFCSEAVLTTVNNMLGQPYSPDVVKMASSFPIGMGKAQCLCGAVSGGQMALGIVYGRNQGEPMNEKMFPIAKELHDYTVKTYGATCCRVITRQWAGDNFMSPERKQHCIHITGDIARWVAKKFIDEGAVKVKEA